MSQKDRQLDLIYDDNDNLFLKQKGIFNKLVKEIFDKLLELNDKIDFHDLTYYYNMLSGFLGILFGPLMEIGLPLIKNAISSLAILIAAVSATDAAIQKKIHGSECPGILALCLSELAQ